MLRGQRRCLPYNHYSKKPISLLQLCAMDHLLKIQRAAPEQLAATSNIQPSNFSAHFQRSSNVHKNTNKDRSILFVAKIHLLDCWSVPPKLTLFCQNLSNFLQIVLFIKDQVTPFYMSSNNSNKGRDRHFRSQQVVSILINFNYRNCLKLRHADC